MSKNADTLEKLDKRFLGALLDALEARKKAKEIDAQLYAELKTKYTTAFDVATDNTTIRDGFVTLQAIAPNPETIKTSLDQLKTRIKQLDNEIAKVEQRFGKLDELLNQGKISENVHHSKRKEYSILIMKYEEQKQEYINAIPDSLAIIQQMNEGIQESLEELEIEKATKSKSDVDTEIKSLKKLQKDVTKVAKELSKIADIDLKEIQARSTPIKKTPPADFTPLKEEIPIDIEPADSQMRSIEQPIRPPPGLNIYARWKGITIGTLIGEVEISNANYAIIATDRPSLSIIQDFASTGPSRLRSSTNPKVVEDRLRKLIQDKYNVSEDGALLPRYTVRYAIDERIGVDIFRLLNSYYASVGKGAVTIRDNEAEINQNAQIVSIAENVNLLGKRVLAPDKSLIGVIHELYYQPETSELYTFAFKGVPPQVIRGIYQDTHNYSMSDNTFGEFRNEISKKLSIPIYEALTPSSIIRYSILSGLISNVNQLVTLVESMNPRVSKISDITSISNQGVVLERFPENVLPTINFADHYH